MLRTITLRALGESPSTAQSEARSLWRIFVLGVCVPTEALVAGETGRLLGVNLRKLELKETHGLILGFGNKETLTCSRGPLKEYKGSTS